MRYLKLRSASVFGLLCLMVIMLAACQPNPNPTVTPIPPTLTATPPGGLSIGVTPTANGSPLPAGSSTSFALSLQYPADKVPQSVAWEAQYIPTGIQAELVGQTTPWQRRLLITADSSLAAGSYTLDVVATVDTAQSVRTAVTVAVTDCVQTESGSSTTGVNSNLVELITAGKPAIEHGLLVPLQVCGSAKHVRVTLTKAMAEDGSTMTTPPAFYIFRSEVWPAPNHITAHGLPELINVQVPNIAQTNTGSQLDADVTSGLYLLIFEHDRFGATLTPATRVSFVTYTVAIQ